MTSADPCFLTIAEAAALIAAKRLSPVELTRGFLDRIERLNGRLHAYVRVLHDEALAAAHAAEAEIAAGRYRGPLHGIPIGLKDIYDTAGVPTEGGSRLCLGRIPGRGRDHDAASERGGRRYTGQIDNLGICDRRHRVRHAVSAGAQPMEIEHDPAGSSSGSGSAVAAGLCVAAMGSDTGGSIRWPAAWCGLAGLKPTYGRVSRAGIMPLSFSLDHAGPLTWTVEDAAIVLQAIAGHDPRDPASSNWPVPDYRAPLARTGSERCALGVARPMFERDCVASEEHAHGVRGGGRRAARPRRRVREIELPPLALYSAAATLISRGEGFAIHERPCASGRRITVRWPATG